METLYMTKEIEKKYLIDINKLPSLTQGIEIKQGYISTSLRATTRIRVAGDKAYLTLKGRTQGLTRTEFEYQIPIEDAIQMLAEFCEGSAIEKTRYLVKQSKHTWEIDVFHGDNHGLVVAEIELGSEDESYDLPEWVTEDVSHEVKYCNSNLLTNPYKNWL